MCEVYRNYTFNSTITSTVSLKCNESLCKKSSILHNFMKAEYPLTVRQWNIPMCSACEGFFHSFNTSAFILSPFFWLTSSRVNFALAGQASSSSYSPCSIYI